jgi:uncharacterized protein YacL
MLDSTQQTCVRSANKLIQANIFTVVGIVILLLLGSHVSEQLSVISNPLFFTKLLCSFVVVVNLWLAAKLPDSEYSTTKPSKSSRFKAWLTVCVDVHDFSRVVYMNNRVKV